MFTNYFIKKKIQALVSDAGGRPHRSLSLDEARSLLSAFKVGIKYPGQEWYDLGLTVTDKDDIQYLFGQILFYLRSIRAK